MDLELAPLSEDYLEVLISIGIPAIGTIIGVLLLWIGGTELAARVRTTAQAARKYVDEPDDC
jgi:ascorbate-specific PTS system EIIC-type component UlaA